MNIKGIREGILITLGTGEWADLQLELIHYIQDQEQFFKGARVALDVGPMAIKAADLGSVRDKLADQGVTLWAVVSQSEMTERNAQSLGLGTRIFAGRVEKSTESPTQPIKIKSGGWFQKNLRSGQSISQIGSVVLIGDVNAGAEVESDQSIIIWGRLRGAAHAGCQGDLGSRIFALEIEKASLRIGDIGINYAESGGKNHPVVAMVENGKIVVRHWDKSTN